MSDRAEQVLKALREFQNGDRVAIDIFTTGPKLGRIAYSVGGNRQLYKITLDVDGIAYAYKESMAHVD